MSLVSIPCFKDSFLGFLSSSCLVSFVDTGISRDSWLLLLAEVVDLGVGVLFDLVLRLELHG